MFKARNIIIIFVLNYLALVVVSAFIELSVINSKAREVMETIRTAADMSLEQTQAIDEYLSKSNTGGYQISVPDKHGNGFIKSDVYSAMLGIDTSTPTGKDQVFDYLYNNNEFKMLAKRAGVMKTPIKYWDSPAHNRFIWYYMPTIAVVGTEILPESTVNNFLRVESSEGLKLNSDWSRTIMEAYGVDKAQKLSNNIPYYNTPLAYGVTYLNEDLLSRLFVNNVDMLMRYKYEEDLNTAEGGNGVLEGATFYDRITDESRKVLDDSNVINNGVFSFVRHQSYDTGANTVAYEGVKPQIQYKLVDMYNPANDRLLKYLFGANTEGYPTKAEYLKSLDSNRINPVTNRPWDSKPIVVAKVTFYADVYIPYFSFVFRDFSSAMSTAENNFIDIKDEGTNPDGSRRISYTRLFAVTP